MALTVYLRKNQATALTWDQIDANFSNLATAVQQNTTAIGNIGGAVGGPTSGRPATPTQFQSYFDTTVGFTVWCSQTSPVIWVNAFGVSS